MVKCVDNSKTGGLLTLYKDYQIIREMGDFYIIKNDKGFEITYSKDIFIAI